MVGSFREAIDADRSEAATIRMYRRADILAISDPTPPKGALSQYAAHMLYRVVDERYRNRQSTFATINAATSAEAIEALTAPVFDRLLDEAIVIFCSWPSYRAARKPSWRES